MVVVTNTLTNYYHQVHVAWWMMMVEWHVFNVNFVAGWFFSMFAFHKKRKKKKRKKFKLILMISFLINEKWVVKFDMSSCWALLMYFTIINRKSWLWFWIICWLGVECNCISVMSHDFLVVCTYYWHFLRIWHLDWIF